MEKKGQMVQDLASRGEDLERLSSRIWVRALIPKGISSDFSASVLLLKYHVGKLLVWATQCAVLGSKA